MVDAKTPKQIAQDWSINKKQLKLKKYGKDREYPPRDGGA